jgi:hypothetical protein
LRFFSYLCTQIKSINYELIDEDLLPVVGDIMYTGFARFLTADNEGEGLGES